MSPASVDQAAAAIARLESSTSGKDFAAFHIEQARKFERDLDRAQNETTGKLLAKATIRSRLMAVRPFFQWLADQPGYKSRIGYADCEYFKLSANDNRVATAKRERPIPTLDQIRHVLETTPHGTSIEKRDRALIAFALLTGMRVSSKRKREDDDHQLLSRRPRYERPWV